MNHTKIYVDISNEIKGDFYEQNINLEEILQENGFNTGREEIVIEGEPATRGIITYLLIRTGEYFLTELLPKLAGKVIEETGDQILDSAVGRILKPIIKLIEGKKKKDEKIVININVLVQKQNREGDEVLELQPLTEEVLEHVEKVLLEIKKDKV
jgi:hypothetical protein